ncbi:MAG: protein kinase [Acidobacteriota bacterium]
MASTIVMSAPTKASEPKPETAKPDIADAELASTDPPLPSPISPSESPIEAKAEKELPEVRIVEEFAGTSPGSESTTDPEAEHETLAKDSAHLEEIAEAGQVVEPARDPTSTALENGLDFEPLAAETAESSLLLSTDIAASRELPITIERPAANFLDDKRTEIAESTVDEQPAAAPATELETGSAAESESNSIDDEAGLASAFEPEAFPDDRSDSIEREERQPFDVLSSDAYAGAVPIDDAGSLASEPNLTSPVAIPVESLELEPEGLDAESQVANTVTAPEPIALAHSPASPIEESDPVTAVNVHTDPGTTPNIGSATTDGRKSGLKPLAEGIQLNGRYRISKKIGGGGMGAVYLAFDQNLGGTQRAVKEMVQSHIEEEQQAKAIDDFKRESMILSTLDHPSIPTIYDYFYDEEESRFYLVMKYISGGDLASRLRAAPEGRIDERTVTEWALQIIDVLDYLHSLPTTIVYRDLKPSNVMIDGNTGRIMLIDFGIARSINQNQEKGVTAVGTMGYAPPELFSGQVEPRSDIYSLGSTMFHLLTGADPQNNPLLIFDFQKNPRPRQINPRLSDQMERILMRAVEYNADARFASAADMRRALHDHLENLRSGNVTYGITEGPAAVSLEYQTVFCGFCGQRIVATDLFCAFCGSKQPIAQQGVHSEIYSPNNVTARLVIEGTSDLDSPAYPLDKNENLVGRRDPMSNIFPEVDLSKYDPQTKISRRHARIWRDGSDFLVEDLGSSNGTLLLGRVSDTLRLSPHKPHPIASGDRLRIGDTTLQFIVG